jgi:hypothetical protein
VIRTRLAVLALLALAACHPGLRPVEDPDGLEAYREGAGRFEILRPGEWHLRRAERDQVEFWRWTPERLENPEDEAVADLTVALIPPPSLAEAAVDHGNLEEVAEYVRDILIMAARRAGLEYRAGPARRVEIGGRGAVRFDLGGRDEEGREQRVSVIALAADDGSAAFLAFSWPEADRDETLPRLERSAMSFRLAPR